MILKYMEYLYMQGLNRLHDFDVIPFLRAF